MLSNEIKTSIQKAYTAFLNGKQLKARLGQKLMIAEIARTLGAIEQDDSGKRTSDPAVCVVEAGTGTGKTVGYCLASIPVARAADKTLVIATATVALQEQVINKDLPEIRKHSGLDFSFTLAKGRRRYLCLQKLDLLLQSARAASATMALFHEEGFSIDLDKDARELYEEMLGAMAGSRWDGDRDNWPVSVDDEQWQQLTATHTQCSGHRCPHFSNCPFYQARGVLDKVDVIVTNHDLVLSDLILGGGVILPPPGDCIYIFDEGHHLPDKAISHFACETRLGDTARWLEQSTRQLEKIMAQQSLPGDVDDLVDRLVDKYRELVADQQFMRDALMSAAKFRQEEETESGRTLVYRFPGGVIPESLRELAGRLKVGFSASMDLADRIVAELKSAMDDKATGADRLQIEQLFSVTGMMLLRLKNNLKLWESWNIADPEGEPPAARWLRLVEYHDNQDLVVFSSLIFADKILRQHLWNTAYGVVVTSATLTALGKFDRYQMRSGLPESANCQSVPSPFRHENAAVLSVPLLRFDPGDASGHTAEIIEQLPALIGEVRGALVLFSSRRQMRDVYLGLADEFRDRVILQDDYPRQELIRRHKEVIDNEGYSVIFGLASLAEGIDLPGVYCEHVIIARIPFAVPDDPVEAALSEWIESRGGNAFMEIAVPDAAIRLVQASGRLLRKEEDTGRITVMDRRLVTRRYGQALLNSMPPYRREIA